MPQKIVPVILSGGSGTRLWPLSRHNYPKQFHALGGKDPLIVQAAKRVGDDAVFKKPVILANQEHRFMIADQLMQNGIDYDSIILEPEKRNTAPAIAAASLYVQQKHGDDALLLVIPSDHVIRDVKSYHDAVKTAAKAASAGYIVCFGIKPTMAETGYGYIHMGDVVKDATDSHKSKAFKEKPDEKTAQSYIDTGEYVWNSGMFLFRADVMRDEIESYEPDMGIQTLKSVTSAHTDLDFLRLEAESFGKCNSISIDYAVMERTKKAAVLPVDFDWSDVGTYNKLWAIEEQDAHKNVLQGNVYAEDTENSYIRSDGPVVVACGVDDLVVVAHRDAMLVTKKSKDEKVGDLVKTLANKGVEQATTYDIDYRPWGSFRSIIKEDRFQGKIIEVLPGKVLSLQKHHHRSEHWIVVQGAAKVTKGDEEIILHENESVYIPIGEVHRLENPGKIPLKLIEIQTGSYLGEDDIIRLEDLYGRPEKG